MKKSEYLLFRFRAVDWFELVFKLIVFSVIVPFVVVIEILKYLIGKWNNFWDSVEWKSYMKCQYAEEKRYAAREILKLMKQDKKEVNIER